MKKWIHTAVLSCAVFAFGAWAGSAPAAASTAEQGVKIQINDSLVAFEENFPFMEDELLYVPVRPLFESLGYHIDWGRDGEGQVSIALQDTEKKETVLLQTDSTEALLGGATVKLPAEIKDVDGAVYVPLRVISESLGYMVQWDNTNGIAIVSEDGKYHAPAWYAPPPAPAPVAAAALAVQPAEDDQVIELLSTAKEYIGIPYKWGGTTTAGFDCSGFINDLFARFDVDLPRTSSDMLRQAGEETDELVEGDLVFFQINRSLMHVGVYMGDDEFISATTNAGVKVDSLSSAYWGPKYIGAKRVM